MAQTTPNLGLKVWNLATDTYKYDELANNFIAIDLHDHSPGNGAPIDGTSIKPGTIGPAQLGANSVNSSNIVDGSVGNAEITPNSISGDKLSTIPGTRITSDNIDNNTIAPSKLISGITPITSTTSSNIVSTLPTSGIYDGYIVDYQYNSNYPIWRLRYNGSTAWDYVGGAAKTSFIAANKTSGGDPQDQKYYTGWGDFSSGGTGGAFNNIQLPLAGKYKVEYRADLSVATNTSTNGLSNSYGVWGIAVKLKEFPTGTDIHETVETGSLSNTYFAGFLNATTSAAGSCEITTNAQQVSDPAKRYVNLAAGFTNRNDVSPGLTTISNTFLSLTPVSVSNW